jgi:hypothetical protein
MDHLVCLFHGGKVKENGEFESTKDEVHFFSKPPTFDALLCRYRDKIGWEVSLKGRFDCGKGRASLVFLWIMQLGFTGHTMLATLIKKRGTSCSASKYVFGNYGLGGKEMVSGRFRTLDNHILAVLPSQRGS